MTSTQASTGTSTATETGEDFFLSFNGFDEIAVARAFNSDISDLREKPFQFLRALVFVHQRRQGLKDPDAFKAAMNLSVREVGDYFAEAEPEIDPDDPETDEGKDDEPSD